MENSEENMQMAIGAERVKKSIKHEFVLFNDPSVICLLL